MSEENRMLKSLFQATASYFRAENMLSAAQFEFISPDFHISSAEPASAAPVWELSEGKGEEPTPPARCASGLG